MTRARRGSVLALVLVAACTAGSERSVGPGPLTGACPDPVVVQADWYPEVEQGPLFHLVDPDGLEVDTEARAVRGRLVARGADTGVDIEVRSGGEAIDHRTVASELHRDPDILLGVVVTDQAIVAHPLHPTVAVVTLLERDPMMIMWDPATFDVDTVAELPPDTVVEVFGPALYLDHLVEAGIVDGSQVHPLHTGTPDRFVAAGGSIAQQGYATVDPHLYEHLVDGWGRPIRFQLVHDTGWEVYGGSLVVSPASLDDRAGCLDLLVPVLQQAIVDYAADPEGTNALIARLVERYDAGWRYDRDLARAAHAQLGDLGLVGDGPDGIVGNFDLERVEQLLDRARQVGDVDPEITVDHLVTNRFIDPAIGLGGADD